MHADLMKQVHRLRRYGALNFKPAQKVRLGLLRCRVQPYSGRYFLPKELAKLAKLDEAGIRIIAEVTLCKRAKPVKLRFMCPHKSKIVRLNMLVHVLHQFKYVGVGSGYMFMPSSA